MQKSVRSHGKFLALVLRQKPGVVGLELDPEGWVDRPCPAGIHSPGFRGGAITLLLSLKMEDKIPL